MNPLGSRGQRQDLLIVLGATFGPYSVSCVTRGGTLVDVTGCTLHAAVRRNPDDAAALLTFDCQLVNPTTRPQFTWGLAATASAGVKAGKDPKDPLSRAWWSMSLRDSAGRVIPLAWGMVTLVRDAAHVV